MKKSKNRKDDAIQPSLYKSVGLPDNSFQMVNNYGTYEIQATADTENQYPCIAQGYNPKIIKNDCENPRQKKQSD